MSDFKNRDFNNENENGNDKDYDLDYFAVKDNDKKDHDIEIDSLQDSVSFEEDFDLNSFSSKGNDSLDDAFDNIGDDGEVNFNNFGKKREQVNKESKANKKRKVKKIAKAFGKVFVSVLLIGIITGCLVVGAFAIYVFNFVDDTVYEDLDELKLDFTTTVYIEDAKSGEYVEYQRLHGEENRIWVDFETIPQNLKNAFVAVEDQRFNEHNGVDWKRTVAAFANMFIDLYSSNQGGSTITQQLVKNLTGDKDQSPMRKIREIMRARYLEGEYEKDTILECYLNTICLANGIYGVEVAANYYFGKSVDELTLVECAAIASLAKEPERYRPDKNPKNNQKRRNIVLRLMYEQDYITKEIYEEAKATELTVVAYSSAINTEKVNSYFIDALIDEVIDGLVEEYNYDRTYASKNFYNGGYKIYCTLNQNVQNVLEEEYLKTDKYFTLKSKKNSGQYVQSAMTVMDYEGHIVGIVGGAGEKTENRGLNRATMSYRHPGSTMKPLAAYSQALQKNIINYSKMVEDSPIPNYFKSGKAGPGNSYSGYAGYMTVAKALERSTNTIPCKLVKQMGVQGTYYYLTDCLGLTSLDAKEDMNLSSLGLGGTYTGITTTQSAAAFAIFGNLGNYYEPTTFTLVKDQHDNVILQQNDPTIAIDENTATIMNHLLQNVVYGSQGTAKAIADYSDTMKCYAKTGTSSDVYDSWLVGGTPYYVASCWFGFDMQEQLYRTDLAKTMWKNVMQKIHKDLEPKEFVDSEFVTKRYYCTNTGLLANDTCTSVDVGYYKTNYSLPSACTTHKGTLRPEIVEEEENEEGNEGTNEGEGNNTSSGNGQTTSKPESKPSTESSSSEASTSYDQSQDATSSTNSSEGSSAIN